MPSNKPVIWPITREVTLVEGIASNWVIIQEDDRWMLIDTGYPQDWENLLSSIASLNLVPSQCARIFITHAHTDHSGNAARAATEWGTQVCCHQLEKSNLTGEKREQVTVPTLLRHISWRVGTWAVHAIKAGGLKHTPIHPRMVVETGPQPQWPLSPTVEHTGVHTSGHSVLRLRSENKKILISGDALITGHPIHRQHNTPFPLHSMFHLQPTAAATLANRLRTNTWDALLPGHGPPHYRNT